MPSCIYRCVRMEDDYEYVCGNWCDTGQDYCPRHQKLMQEVDELDRIVQRLIRDRIKKQ